MAVVGAFSYPMLPQKRMRAGFKSCPHTLTVYNRGDIKRSIYTCSINIVQLLMIGGGGSTQQITSICPLTLNPEPLNLKPSADCCVNMLTLKADWLAPQEVAGVWGCSGL